MKYIKALSLILLLSVTTMFGQSAKASPESKLFDAAQLLRDIQTLSADDMEGRSAQLPSMEKARGYVERRFSESGLEPLGASFRQEFGIRQRSKSEPLKGINYVGQIKGKG